MEIKGALKLLERRVDEAEIYRSKEHSQSLGIKKGEVDLLKVSMSEGYGVRVIIGKKMGFAFSNRLNEAVLDRAVNSAKIAEADIHLSMPPEQKYGRGGGLDREIESLGTEDLLEFIKELISPCKGYKVTPTSGAINTSSYEEEIANLHGLFGRDCGTTMTAYLSTVAGDTDVATGFYYDTSRFLDLNFEEIGKEAARLARSSVDAQRVGTMNTNLILRPHAVSELLENTLIPSFNADSVQRKRSFLAGRVGEKIAPGLDMTDDGTLKDGLSTGKFDAEGVSSKKTALVKDGKLRGFMYDTYAANKEGTESTGNAWRDSFSTLPQIAPSNMVVSGKGNIGEGLVVHGLIGAHTSNPASGDFSVETRNAFLDGKPVKKAIISGNVFELLKNIEGFGKDVKQVSSVVSPSIEFSDITVVG